MNFELSASDFVVLGAVLWVMVIGRVTRSESRLLAAALIAAVLAPSSPYPVVAVGVFGVLFKAFDVVRGA